MMKTVVALATVCTVSLFGAVEAAVCDYKPSKLVGSATTAAAAAVAGTAVASGAGMQAAGYYTLVHAGSGLTMLGSTAAGTSAAGTVGIIGGTGGFLGSVGAFLMAPVTLVVGGITLVGVGGYEGACYFYVERVTDPEKIREIVDSVAVQDPAVRIVETAKGEALGLTVDGEEERYLIENLYIADGELRHRDWFFNTNLGRILYAQDAPDR